jgi:Flp pilus assembly protein TadG
MFRLRRTKNSAQPRRLGAATVETALVLPVFFMVMVGIVEIGRAFMISQLLTNAAREGGRVAIMKNSTNAQVIQTIQEVAQKTAGIAPADLTIVIDITEYPGNPATGEQVASANKRDLCQVTVRVAYSKVNLIPVKFLSGTQLTGQCAMRHE